MDNQQSAHKLLIISKDFLSYKKILEQATLPGLTICSTDDADHGLQIGKECDLLFGEPALLSKVINNFPVLVWAQSTWAGIEPLLQNGLRRDYILTNARNVYGDLMSEYVFGYLLLIERKIIEHIQSQQQRYWNDRSHGTLKGKVIGLLGVGSIGAHLALTAHHFDMKVYGLTRKSESCKAVDRYFHLNETQNFMADLDFLVCCLPETTATKHLVNAEFLSMLTSRAWLFNIGRGSTIDECALVNALMDRNLAGAVLDVFEEEPLPQTHPLWSTPNTYITNHTAAINHPPDIAELFIQNYHLLINQKPLQNQVDFDAEY